MGILDISFLLQFIYLITILGNRNTLTFTLKMKCVIISFVQITKRPIFGITKAKLPISKIDEMLQISAFKRQNLQKEKVRTYDQNMKRNEKSQIGKYPTQNPN